MTSATRWATGSGPVSIADANDRAQFAELETLGELTKLAWEDSVQVMIEGPGHVPMHKIKVNMEKQLEECGEAPFYTLGPLTTDIAPGYDHNHIGHRRRDDRLVRHSAALLRDAEGASRVARPRRRQGGGHHLQDRRARVRSLRRATRQRASATTPCRGRRIRVPLARTVQPVARPRDGREVPRPDPAGEGAKLAHFCSMCGPKFCSMQITQEIRDYARAGMEEKSKAFLEQGAEIYAERRSRRSEPPP